MQPLEVIVIDGGSSRRDGFGGNLAVPFGQSHCAPATVRHVESLATETPYSIHPARVEAHAIGGFEPDWRYAR